MDAEEAAKVIRESNARALAKAAGSTQQEAEETLGGIEEASEAKLRSIDPPAGEMAERRERHADAWGQALDEAAKAEAGER